MSITSNNNVAYVSEKLGDLDVKVARLERRTEESQTALFTVFGIFSSVVIFLSVQVQILQQARSLLELAMLSSVTLVGLLLFLGLYYLISTQPSRGLICTAIIAISLLSIIFILEGKRLYEKGREDGSSRQTQIAPAVK